mmetsp:Transcript_12213/g.32427  ORF Transcript_12213/g.32427 Transcript_12213/m.32427 type:complete len:536 (-) Transcript_12213:46-1653(-)
MDAALSSLSTLISGKRRSEKGSKNWSEAFGMMDAYISGLHLSSCVSNISERAIHVAGTKGKGSTCAMCESILRHSLRGNNNNNKNNNNTPKTGLFTSPHLVDVRERIRINGAPVAEDIFLQHFWELFHACERLADEHDKSNDVSSSSSSGGALPMPAYFRFMTLLALKIFDAENVDVAIFEVGLGGRLDATNVLPKPLVTAVTPLGYDHMELLGHTLGAIAREKAGIFKKGVPAFTVHQEDDAMESLRARAAELDIPLYMPPSLPDDVVVGLAGQHQRVNAALAVALCLTWEARNKHAEDVKAGDEAPSYLNEPITPEYREGLQAARWPGRAQVEDDEPDPTGVGSDLTFYLDGAHTPESIAACADWFVDVAAKAPSPTPTRVLLFNCQEERTPLALLQPLHERVAQGNVMFDRAMFVPPDSSTASLKKDGMPKDALTWQQNLGAAWQGCALGSGGTQPSSSSIAVMSTHAEAAASLASTSLPRSSPCVVPSLGEAIEALRLYARGGGDRRKKVEVLVTGSLYLVGDVLRLLKRL